jgi:hypothetical protein
MTSPSSSPIALQGSSRTTGGSTRGHATGNVFNFADADMELDHSPVLRTGAVQVYTSQVNPTEVQPFRTLKININFSMAPVLKSMAAKWSPIESMMF